MFFFSAARAELLFITGTIYANMHVTVKGRRSGSPEVCEDMKTLISINPNLVLLLADVAHTKCF